MENDKIKDDYIPSIDLMRIICAFMVVAIHIVPFDRINENIRYILIEIIPRIAVPFFFVVSGFFVKKNLDRKNNKIYAYSKKIIFTYLLWSCIYFIYDYIMYAIPNKISLITMLKMYIIEYLYFGPKNHLWYFHGLIFCIAIATICYRYYSLKKLYILSLFLYFIGLLGCSYYNIGINIPILNLLFSCLHFLSIRRIFLMGFSFFMLGIFIKMNIYNIKKLSDRKLIKALIIIYILFIIEIIIVNKMHIAENIIITLFLYPLVGIIFILCLKNPMYKMRRYKSKFRSISNFTYYLHPLIYSILIQTTQNNYTISNTLLYVAVCILSGTIALIIEKINNKKIKILIS